MKTVSCPSCGASATNHQNCEFCGSLFVRYDAEGLNPNEIFKNNSFTGFTFPGLTDHLQKNLASQTPNTFMVTDVLKGNEVLLQIVQSSAISDLLPEGGSSLPGVSVHMPFGADTRYLEPKFKSMEEHKLFTISSANSSDGFQDYAIDYGNDSIGAAFLSSKILLTVYSCVQSDALTFNTSDYNVQSADSNASGSCFIATATMGDYDHPDVMELRHLRDEWILNKSWGEKFVKWYYNYGAIAARVIEKSTVLKKLSYAFIVKPLVSFSRILNQK